MGYIYKFFKNIKLRVAVADITIKDAKNYLYLSCFTKKDSTTNVFIVNFLNIFRKIVF